jgi:hypothetical protein
VKKNKKNFINQKVLAKRNRIALSGHGDIVHFRFLKSEWITLKTFPPN